MSENYEISGEVIKVGDVQLFDSGFTKAELVIKTGGQYPQEVPIEFLKDNVSKIDGLKDGDFVTVSFNVRGREYNGRYFVNLTGWRVSCEAQSEPATSEADRPKLGGVTDLDGKRVRSAEEVAKDVDSVFGEDEDPIPF